jgi:6-phosphogluconate dehydrogenase
VDLGMIGLGRMGSNLVRRLHRGGHRCVVHDRDPRAVEASVADGARGALDLAALVGQLESPRAVWVMVPAEVTGAVLAELAEHLEPGDVVIDGGNSFYRDTLERAAALDARGVHLVDVGTSGGVWGLERGYCLMVGGEPEPVQRLRPLFEALAPGIDTAPRTAGRSGPPAAGEEGWLHCGPVGTGHFVKMVHNGIEYGLMAAYAEGLNLLRHAEVGPSAHTADASAAPQQATPLPFQLDVAAITELWRRGSVVSSWLLDLTAAALAADPGLDAFGGRVGDSGEGRWTVISAVEAGVPVPVLSAALYQRFSSRGNDEFGAKVLSAMRQQFGGHREAPPAG